MADKIYPKGVKGFLPKAGAKDFVLGTLIIEPRTLTDWLCSEEGETTLKDHNGTKQLKLSMLRGRDGQYVNFQVDTYEAQSKPAAKESQPSSTSVDPDDLPF